MFGMWNVWDVGCWGCGMFGMWDVRDVGCSGYAMFGMLGMCDVRDVGCSGCAMFRTWDVGCGMFAGMWDVDLQNAVMKLMRDDEAIILMRDEAVFITLKTSLDHLNCAQILFLKVKGS